jgi:hypothetical protein
MSDCLQNATWLERSLDQRATTILKVATEIVRQQDAFFVHGVSALKPMTMKMVADAIGMHESTVSRVSANKYMLTPRGMFEFRYFFTVAIGTSNGAEEGHSSEAVRQRIRALIDKETPDAILSDDALVAMLKQRGHRHRETHRRQIPRGHEHRLFRAAPPRKTGACRRRMAERIAAPHAQSRHFSACAASQSCFFRPICGLGGRLKTNNHEELPMGLRVSGKHMDIGDAFRERIEDRIEEALSK